MHILIVEDDPMVAKWATSSIARLRVRQLRGSRNALGRTKC